jgi:hypothetical protein
LSKRFRILATVLIYKDYEKNEVQYYNSEDEYIMSVVNDWQEDSYLKLADALSWDYESVNGIEVSVIVEDD